MDCTNNKEPIFIDRDPELFKHVLRFLRDPKYNIPIICYGELEYFGIESDVKEDVSTSDKDIVLKREEYNDIFKSGYGQIVAIVAHGVEDGPMTHHTPFLHKTEIIKPMMCAHSKSIIHLFDKDTFKIDRQGDLLYCLSLQFRNSIPDTATA